MSRNNTLQKNSGFTLVEMLVAIAIFTTFMIVAIGALVSIISENDKAQTIKSVIDNVTLAVDSISRDVREGTNYSCLDSHDNLSVAPCSGVGLMYLDPTNQTGTPYVKYQFVTTAVAGTSTGNIQKITGCNAAGACGTNVWQSITAPTANVNISNMSFMINGDGTTGQPRVFITADGFIAVAATNGQTTEFDIQTTASQRVRN